MDEEPDAQGPVDCVVEKEVSLFRESATLSVLRVSNQLEEFLPDFRLFLANTQTRRHWEEHMVHSRGPEPGEEHHKARNQV